MYWFCRLRRSLARCNFDTATSFPKPETMLKEKASTSGWERHYKSLFKNDLFRLTRKQNVLGEEQSKSSDEMNVEAILSLPNEVNF